MLRVITAAQLDGYSRRKDKSVSIRFITSEKTSEEVANIDRAIDQFGYLYFKAEESLTPDEVAELDALDTDLYDAPKTQSQRMRNVLYRLWEQDGKPCEFKEYYRERTERIINHLKNKLDV